MSYVDDFTARLGELTSGAPVEPAETAGGSLAEAMYGYGTLKLTESAARSEQELTAARFKIAAARVGQWFLQPVVLLVVAGVAVFLVMRR